MHNGQLTHFLLVCSKIQKYSPTESAKVYDKAVNRKTNVHFKPRQTIDFLSNNWANVVFTHDIKTRIVKQYLDVSVRLWHHLHVPNTDRVILPLLSS